MARLSLLILHQILTLLTPQCIYHIYMWYVCSLNNLKDISKSFILISIVSLSACLKNNSSNGQAAATATQLAFIFQPLDSYVDSNLNPSIKIAALDASGNLDASFNGQISIELDSNLVSASLSGVRTVAALDGVASFSNIKLDKVGYGFTLLASSAGLSSDTSDEFSVTAGPASASFLSQYGIASKAANAYAIAVDGAGNSYVGGSTNANLVAGVGNSTGVTDYYFAKYDSSGNQLWIKQDGVAIKNSKILGVASDLDGNTCVAGVSSGALEAGHTMTGFAYMDFFMARYDVDGNRLWIKQLSSVVLAGSTQVASTSAASVGMDSSGDCIGMATSTKNLVSGSGASTGVSDVFVVKFDSDGNQVWLKQFGGAGSATLGYRIAVDKSGNSFLSGKSNANLVAGSGASTGTNDAFLIKLNSSGDLQWIKQFGVAGNDIYPFNVTTDLFGNVYYTGYTPNDLAAGSGSATGTYDMFLAQYSPDGERNWIHQLGVAGQGLYGLAVAIDAFGQPTVLATTSADLTSGAIANTGGVDLAIIKYDRSGHKLWHKQFGQDSKIIYTYSLAADQRGNVFFHGSTTGYLPSLSGDSVGSYDMFVGSCDNSGICR